MTARQQARNQGKQDSQSGRYDNPYESGTPLAVAYLDGWLADQCRQWKEGRKRARQGATQ